MKKTENELNLVNERHFRVPQILCEPTHYSHPQRKATRGQEMSSCTWHTLINTLSCYHALRKSPECQSVKPDWLRYKEHGRQRHKPSQAESGTSGDAKYTHGLVYALSWAVGPYPVQLKQTDRNYQNKGSGLSTWRTCKTVILFLLGQSMWHLPSFVSVLYRLCKRQVR